MSIYCENKNFKFEMDSGSGITLMPYEMYKKKLNHIPLNSTKLKAVTLKGTMNVIGQIQVKAEYKGNIFLSTIYIYDDEADHLICGRSWLEAFKPPAPWLLKEKRTKGQVHHITGKSIQSCIKKLKKKYCKVFDGKPGTLKGVKVHVEVSENCPKTTSKPKRPLLYNLKERTDKEIDNWLENDYIEPVPYHDHAAPIVVKEKDEDSVRICGDFSVTVNPHLVEDQYPLPVIQDLFATLQGGKKYSVLDMSGSFMQMVLDEESSDYFAIITHRGVFRLKRLPYGSKCAPSIFQRTMEMLLAGIPGVCIYLDDILITAENDEQHLERLEQVLKRLEESGLKLNEKKCRYMEDEIKYLGHVIDASGLHPDQDKVTCILNAPAPKDESTLRAFLGQLTYYTHFIDNLSTLTAPLNKLLRKEQPWVWGEDQQTAFEKCKKALTSDTLLVHYDQKKPVVLDCDASSYGLGAVISHIYPDGTERPIAYASRSMTQAEKNYSQIDREGLSIIFGVRKFKQYLLGRHFTLRTDHQPLVPIFGCKKGLPALAASRMHRWAETLMAYSFDIVHRQGKKHQNADALSRLPLPTTEETEETEAEVHCLTLRRLPVKSTDIAKATREDPILSFVLDYVQHGNWPEHNKVSKELKPYYNLRNSISSDSGCILIGNRVIIPDKYREYAMKLLHESHLGMTKMKATARCYVWWPGINQEIESKVNNCDDCLMNRDKPAEAPLHPWKWASSKWERIHVDFAEEEGKDYLVIVDTYSKWPEVFPMKKTDCKSVCSVLRYLFSVHGFPKQVVSDGGPPFNSKEYKEFLSDNGIEKPSVPPYHPSSNGQVERYVKIFKRGMKKLKSTTLSLSQKIATVLMTYRNTKHQTTQRTPAEMFLKIHPRTKLTMLKPHLEKDIEKSQATMKVYHDKKSAKKTREFTIGEKVKTRDYRGGNPRKKKMLDGIIVEKLGSVRYLIDVGYTVYNRHVDQIEKIGQNVNLDLEGPQVDMMSDIPEPPDEQELVNEQPVVQPVVQRNSPPPLRRSCRERKPNRLYFNDKFSHK